MKSAILPLIAAAALAQGPAFELASIKPSDPAATVSIKRSGHRISTTATSVQFLITWAYDIQSDHLLAKPGWLDSVRYDVLASAPEDRPARVRRPGQPTELQEMMQALLAERFKLAVHREKREFSVYALVIAKDGPKFKLAEPPDVFGQNPFRMPSRGKLLGTQVNAEMLAKVLSGQLDRTVQDHTGLRGVFDFQLEWEPDQLTPGRDRIGPSLFTAIQDQLGLKLEARKGTVDVLVIDHVENTPTAN